MNAPVTRAGWQCPGCRTYYSPDVQECRCEAARRTLADRLKPEVPIQLGGALIRIPATLAEPAMEAGQPPDVEKGRLP